MATKDIENTTVETDEADFFVPERYDDAVAKTGEWISVEDENEVIWGKFKCRWFDRTNPEVKKGMEAARIKHAKAIRTGTADIDVILLETFVDYALVDWELKNAKGKAIAFSRENAIKYFNIKRVKEFALPKLMEAAGDVRNFGKADKDDILGN